MTARYGLGVSGMRDSSEFQGKSGYKLINPKLLMPLGKAEHGNMMAISAAP